MSGRKWLLVLMIVSQLLLAACGAQSNENNGANLNATATVIAGSSPSPILTSVPTTEAADVTAAPEVTPSPAAEPSPTGIDAEATATPSAAEAQTYRLVILPESSEARYRVREQLAGRSLPNDAIGVTKNLSGTLVIQADGTIVTEESRFEVDLTTLRSDSSRRDGYIQNNTLETSRYPTAVFEPQEAIGLPSPLPTSGDLTFKLLGEMSVREITQTLTWEVQARAEGQELSGIATTAFTWADFNMTPPRVPVLLSLEDTIKLEMDFRMAVQQP